MLSPRRRLAVAPFALLLSISARPAGAAAPPPPTDTELTKYVAVNDALAGDVARRDAICAMQEESWLGDGGGDELAVAARRAEAHPILGPLLRQKGLAGRRFVELSVQVASVMIGAAIADAADATERAAGRPAKSREALLASTPAAAPILARQADLTRALEAVQAVCERDADDGYDDEGYDDEPPEGRAAV
jgi:hypothetical protein